MRHNRGDHDQAGQAMVELVFILIFIMAMCAGMLASMRLLTFQFWAQQEARYIAFEQTWSSHDFYTDPDSEPIAKLDDGGFFGRPKVVSDRTKTKEVQGDGALSELLAWFRSEDPAVEAPTETVDEAPIMLANNGRAWYQRKTEEWFQPGGVVNDTLALVNTAVASQDIREALSRAGLKPDIFPSNSDDIHVGGSYSDRLQGKLETFFKTAQVGEKVCSAWESLAARRGSPAFAKTLTEGNCSERISLGLAETVAQGVDPKAFFEDFQDRMDSGFTPREALENGVRQEIASGFYSLFDSIKAASRNLAVPALVGGRVEVDLALIDSSSTDLLTEFRYVGSNVAIAALGVAATLISANSPLSRDAEAERVREEQINDILHMDAEDALPGPLSPYFLFPTFLPVPPTFGAAAAGMQEAVMKNLLSQSEDSGLRDEQIENSNKTVEVTYEASGGLFRLARNRIAGADAAKLTARFFLVTQPWHMTRRQDKTGAYRDKGTQTDTAGDETEEAVMRRRVLGLWLFPSDPAAFLEPISLIPGLGFLGPVFQAFEPLGSFISIIKRFVTDNPLFDIAQALSEIPVIGDLVPVPPVWPTVRPDAYPKSEEMTGNAMADRDKLMNGERNFKDYVDEQRDNNPEPEPDFN